MTQIVNHAAARAQAAQGRSPTLGGASGSGRWQDMTSTTNAATPSTGDGTSATDIINNFLNAYGLESLSGWAFDQLKQNKFAPEILIEMQKLPEYKARFPAMEVMKAQHRQFTEGDYVNYEDGVRSLTQQYGIPYEMYGTPAAIAKLIINDVKTPEMTERLNRAAYAAFQAPPEVKQAYSSLYGLSQGDLIATYLDADKALPILQNKAAAAQVAGAAYRQGMATDVAEAERLAAQGIDYNAALQGYGQAQSEAGLDYAGGLATTRSDRVAAAFGDTEAQRRVRQSQEARAAAFQGGGGLAADQAGISALGRGTA